MPDEQTMTRLRQEFEAGLDEYMAEWRASLESALADEEGMPEAKDDSGHEHGEGGRFASGGGGAAGEKAAPDKLPATPEQAIGQAQERAKGWLTRAASLPGKAVSYAAGKAAALYAGMERKYGPKWAKAIVAVGIVTFPTPFTTGAVLATVGLAKLSQKVFGSGAATEADEGSLDMDRVFELAAEFVDELKAETADQEPEEGLEEADDAVGRKIAKLRAEGYKQDQAIAIALDMQRRGELSEGEEEEEDAENDPEQVADLMADIIGGVYEKHGVDPLALFDSVEDVDDPDPEDVGESRLLVIEGGIVLLEAWSDIDHPRGKGGRFIPKNSPEAHAAAKEAIGKALKKKPTPEGLKELTEHLSILTVKQLTELKKEYGLSASGKTRDALREKIAARLHAGRREPRGPKASVQREPGKGELKPAPAAAAPAVDRAAAERDILRLNAELFDKRTGLPPLIPRLADELKKSHPGLTDQDFHSILQDMQKRDLLTMQTVNDPRLVVPAEHGGSSAPGAEVYHPDRFPRGGRHGGMLGWIQQRPDAAEHLARQHQAQSAAKPAATAKQPVAAKIRDLTARSRFGDIDVADLHDALEKPDLASFHKTLNELRRAGAIEMSEHEGRYGITPRQQETALIEPSSRTGGLPARLTGIRVLDAAKLAAAMKGQAGPAQ